MKTAVIEMSQTKFEKLAATLVARLTDVRDGYKAKVRQILMQYSQDLACLAEGQLEELGHQLDGLCTSNDLLKARMYGEGHMPEHIVLNTAITPKTWEGLPENSKRNLSNPDFKVQIAVRNGVLEVPAKALTPEQTYKVILPSHPGQGMLAPSEQGKMHTSRSPEFYSPAGVERDGKYVLLVGVMFRPLTNDQASIKIRYTVAELEKILKDLKSK